MNALQEDTPPGPSTVFRPPTSSRPLETPHCREIRIGIAGITITLSLCGCANARAPTLRSATADNSENTGFKNVPDLRTDQPKPPSKKRSCDPSEYRVSELKESLITTTPSRPRTARRCIRL
uniref:Apoptin n=2 Tax=Chicken anemia virus TaxID=12618 RepID=Q9WB33_9VIRU|nr:VP3 [Chicken anemia virus]AEB91656.1 apoptin [Chicken anemia virus]AIC32733.1 apoptin [Chicken anemia virus]AIC32784.1 apoptin [Chicken anemia virus]AIC32793.1 apoptin [Chicken anemia virus]